ncbi:MAG: ribosomal protein S18-alanine N-acetyltransferase [Clostridia bacterium]|nr:ribosomal protein S18-alanine N-acetyltransferase [Clostridia bacterium]
MENKISINKMTLEDLNSIENILITDFDDFWNFNILKQEFLSDTTSLFVAKKEDEIVGFIGVQFILNEANITNIVTKKQSRNQGIGSALLNYAINYSKCHNMISITLEVNENNSSALSLYKKSNFKQVGLRKNYYNGTDNAIIMTLLF